MQSIKKNYIYSVIYQIITIVVPLITAPYLTRTMGVEKLGIYSYTNSVVYYFYIFAMLGMANYGNRTVAAVRENKEKLNIVFSELYCVQVFVSLVVIAVYSGYVIYQKMSGSEYYIYSLIWELYLLSAVFDINWFFWGIEKFSVTVTRNTVVKLLTTIGIFVVVKNSEDLIVYIFLIAFCTLVSSIILWIQMKKYVKMCKVNVQKALKKYFVGDFILFIPTIAVSLYTIMDKIMLGNLYNMQGLGIYDNIQKIMILPTGIITALGTVMLPRAANLLANGRSDKVMEYLSCSLQFSNFFSIALTFGLSGIAPCFTIIYFGKEFRNTSVIMELFCITIIFIAWANVIRTQFLIPGKKDKIYIISVFLGAAVNVIINLCLIPGYGAIGAVVGTIFAEGTVALVQSISVKKEICLLFCVQQV